MADSTLWKDISDISQIIDNGKYFLYRHRRIEKSSDIINFKDQNSPDDTEFVSDPTPIATGFSAFLFIGLPNEKSYYQFHDLYDTARDIDFLDQYFAFRHDSHYNKYYYNTLSVQNPEIFLSEFLLCHFKEEKENYLKSERFFNEILNDKDKQIKGKLNAYTLNYLQFLQKKIDPLLGEAGLISEISLITSINSENNFSNTPAKNPELSKNIVDDFKTRDKRETVPLEIKDIWIGTPEQYKSVMEILSSISITISETAFIKQVNGKLYWQNPAKYRRDKYLSGFLYTCLVNGLILNKTAIAFSHILSNTFNINCKPDAFKSISANPPDNKYLKPFKSFPDNS